MGVPSRLLPCLMPIKILNRRSLVIALPIFFVFIAVQPITSAFAVDCVSTACISVYIENGQIVIEGRKDAPAPKVRVKPRVTRSPKPLPSPSHASATPVPVISATPHSSSPSVRVTRKPVVRKKVVPKVVHKVVATLSLNDRLVKILPTANIAKQPDVGAVIGVPVIFWCDLPALFTTKVSIIGEVIDVTMRPAFFWSFGDGSLMMTTESGAPYPADDVSHTYSRSGIYPIVLVSIWEGTWIHNGIARAITGTIRKTSLSHVKVAPAPTIFRK
jgi:hypothetical protein